MPMDGRAGSFRRRLNRRKLLRVGASGAAGLLVACGRSANQPASRSTGSVGQQTNPQSGGTLNVAAPADFFDFDASTNGLQNNATSLAYDSLLGFKQGAGVPYNQVTVTPRLAERWEISPDATTYTFHLRKNVRFANVAPMQGRLLTASDVKFSYEYYSRTAAFADKKLKPSIFNYMFEGLDRIETPDDQTVAVHFKQPFAPFLSYSSIPNLSIVPHEIYDQDGSFTKHMAGTGPFQLDSASSQSGTQWVFRKNPTYWDRGKPYLDEIRCLVLPDAATQRAAFQSRQIDVLLRVTDPKLVATIKQGNPDAVAQDAVDPNVRIMWLSMRRPPFTDLRLRKAVSLGVDRDELIKVMTGGKGEWALPASLPDTWSQQEVHQIFQYNQDQAKQLVTEAVGSKEIDLELMFIASRPEDVQLSQLIQSQLKRIGINITNKQVDVATFGARQHTGDFGSSLAAAVFFADLDSRLSGVYLTGSGSNYTGLSDPKLDQMIAAQRREPDPAKRQGLIKDASRFIAENYYETTLYRQVLTTFWHPQVKNYSDNWVQLDWNAPGVWLAR